MATTEDKPEQMLNVPGRLIYRCRRCEAIMERPVPNIAILGNTDAWIAKEGRLDVALHSNCDAGGFGLCDLVGAAPNEATTAPRSAP